MKTLPLRDLMRHPATVKTLTAKGQSVRITDNGKPLWVVSPAPDDSEDDAAREQARHDWMDKHLEELLAETPLTKVSVVQTLIDARGNG